MSNIAGSKYKLERKLKRALGRAEITMDDVKSIDKRKQKGEGKVKEQSRKYQMDGVGSVQRMYNGYNSRKTVVHEKKRPGLESSRKERKRTFSSQEIGKHKSDDIEVTSRRSLSADGINSCEGNLIKDKRSMKAKAGETATSDRKVFPVRGKKFKDDDPVIEKSSRTTYTCRKNTIQYTKFRDVDLSRRKPLSVKRRKSRAEDSIEDKSRCKRLHISRTCDGENDRIQDKKHSVTVKDSAKRLVITEVGVRSKAKVIDRKDSTEKFKASDDEALLGKHMRSKFKSNKNAEKRNSRNHTGSLDNSGKKKAVHKKSSDDESVVTDNLPKKSKRVIRIDPHDISNKRIDDSISTNEKTVQEMVELSKNAQFRAIQPSPAILSFVEDNLLGRRRLIELRRAGYNIELSSPLDNIPFSTSSERERIEESVFRNKLTFFAAAKVSSSFPPADLPEIAFAGRSNVGKSSLLNALTRQWGVVRTSDKPGLTQTINFFKLASKLCLVDLPGYGFAYAKEEVKEAWQELVKEYVSTRAGLKRVCVLIDTKWGMKPRDQELIDLMERSQTKYQIVLTKTDLVFPVDVARRAMQIQECLKTNKSVVNPLMMVSSKSGAGICSLRAVLAKIARFAKP